MTASSASSEERTGPDAPTEPRLRLEPEPVGALSWALLAIVLVPIVVAIVRVLTGLGGFHATSDNALNELMVRDVGRHPILLGPFSRDGWSHPGPLFYYLNAIPYRLFGADSAAMLANALLINGISIGVMVTIAKRWGGLALALPVLLVAGVLVLSLPSGSLENPWNPFVTVLPFGAFLMAAWAATCGDRWAFPAAAFIGTFCMQTHVGYVALVVAVLAWCGWRAWRDRAISGLAGWWWAVGTLTVVWIPPILEQIIRDPGNIRSIVHYFRTTPEPAHTLAEGARVMAAQFSLAPDWLVGLREVNPFSGQPAAILSTPVPILLIPFLLAVAAAFRSRDRRARRLAAILLIPLGVGIIALARTVGSMYEYRLRWIWVLAALCMAFTIAEAARRLGRRLDPDRTRLIVAACMVATLALGSFGVARTTSFEPPDVSETKAVAVLALKVLHHLPRRPGIVLMRATSFSSSAHLAGLTLALERAGVRVGIEPSDSNRLSFGANRVVGHRPLRARLVIVTDREIESVAARFGARRIAYLTSVPSARRVRALREFQRLEEREVSGLDPRFARIGRDLVAVAVFMLPLSNRQDAPTTRADR